MSRRGRAIAFAGLAFVCAVASASIASGYRESVDERLGELRSVVTVARPLPAGTVLRGRVLRSALTTRTVPTRFLPPDAIADPAQVSGRRTLAPIPAGSYLLASHLRSAKRREPRRPAAARRTSIRSRSPSARRARWRRREPLRRGSTSSSRASR